MKQLKLIWDFRGPDALGTAEHYKIHLDQFATANEISVNSAIEEITGMYATATMIVDEKAAESVIAALRPHRTEEFNP